MIVATIKYNHPTIDGIYFPPYFYNIPLLVCNESDKTVSIKWKDNIYTFNRHSLERSL